MLPRIPVARVVHDHRRQDEDGRGRGPPARIDQYLADAKAGGHAIRHVFLTHFHADFIAGHIELGDKAGATIHLGRRAEAEFSCVQIKDGDLVEFGDVKLEIMETPGHTPESISILVYDLATSRTEPLAVLTGDTLFIGTSGGPRRARRGGRLQGLARGEAACMNEPDAASARQGSDSNTMGMT